ncbi:MSC_0621 family F1-like ATPase epsilon subunit [Mycoplasmopsis opalescens]|uniref:MSC_0621 family F1-like ATPase epsilon subunit n=1 Tax=Mycoplasmopsis opalescens TaxID=114886 RepID=UPI0004A72DF1|nr:hypothetical protein [Mycoplasmopsis opalescens]
MSNRLNLSIHYDFDKVINISNIELYVYDIEEAVFVELKPNLAAALKLNLIKIASENFADNKYIFVENSQIYIFKDKADIHLHDKPIFYAFDANKPVKKTNYKHIDQEIKRLNAREYINFSPQDAAEISLKKAFWYKEDLIATLKLVERSYDE